MSDKLYDLMDWANIEALVYSEEDHPEKILGPRRTSDGILIQAFFPEASEVTVLTGARGRQVPMVMEDETGFFAALIPGRKIPSYRFRITEKDGTVRTQEDPYRFSTPMTEEITRAFNSGICYDVYRYLGAHPMQLDGVDGVYFAVWAPNALRVSLVGDFNHWDGRSLPMRRLWDSGIFDLFVPGLGAGVVYKYELKAKGGLTYLKADPYAQAAQKRPDTASVVADLSSFQWNDQEWMSSRADKDWKKAPVSVLEVHLGTWDRPDDGREFYNYRELADSICAYCLKQGYTHVELLPVMEYPHDESWGYQTCGFYAPTARYGSPADFMYFVDKLHQAGIGVILDWAPAHFPRDIHGLCGFDGTCLYEHLDPRKGTNPHLGTLLFNYGRPEVSNYLSANAMFWKEVYHADGLRMDSVSSMLYLDYGKGYGEWVANMYGGNENLEAVDFLKNMNSVFHAAEDGAFTIAEETSAWPKVTAPPDQDGLGFDFKWNNGWKNDFVGYMQLDPIFRSHHHGELIFSMVYAYSENFMLALGHDEMVAPKGTMISKMPGKRRLKYANLRAAYGFMAAHPGKKLLFMGQDLAQFDEWKEDVPVDWELEKDESHQQMQNYICELNRFYREHPALYASDYDPEGFVWINNISANENMLVFLRRDVSGTEDLLVVCNFSPLVYENHKIGVPYPGKYKEIFTSDLEKYGGNGNRNARVKIAKKSECDGRDYSVRITVPPLGISIFSCKKASATEE